MDIFGWYVYPNHKDVVQNVFQLLQASAMRYNDAKSCKRHCLIEFKRIAFASTVYSEKYFESIGKSLEQQTRYNCKGFPLKIYFSSKNKEN